MMPVTNHHAIQHPLAAALATAGGEPQTTAGGDAR